MLYRLRAKAEITKRIRCLSRFHGRMIQLRIDRFSRNRFKPLRDTALCRTGKCLAQLCRASAGDGEPHAWHAFRIASGVAESGADYALGDAFPHDVLLDQNGGVGFRRAATSARRWCRACSIAAPRAAAC